MKSRHLAAILITMLERGADVSFYSSIDQGVCHIEKLDQCIISVCVRADVDGSVYGIPDIDEWVDYRKDDVERFILTGKI